MLEHEDIDDISQRIERIKHKIIERNIHLNARLSQCEIDNFEAQHNIYLPESYRRFLLEIGNGGSGPPYYGLVSLPDTVSKQRGLEMPPDARMRLRPDLAFPLSDIWDRDEELEKCEDEQLSLEDESEQAALVEAFVAQEQAIYEQGHLYLGTEGCGEDWILVITGNERGYIWNRAESITRPCVPRQDFLSWYEYWLDNGSKIGLEDWLPLP